MPALVSECLQYSATGRIFPEPLNLDAPASENWEESLADQSLLAECESSLIRKRGSSDV